MYKVIDKVYSYSNRFENNITPNNNKINASFVYNFYESDETIEDDSYIDVSPSINKAKNRFINLDIPTNIKNLYSNNNDYNEDQFVNDIYNISQKKSLNTNDILLFNKIDQMIPQRKFLNYSFDSKETKSMLSFYGEDPNNNSAYTLSKKISILNDDNEETNIKFSAESGILPEFELKNEIDSYFSLVRSNIDIEKDDVIDSYQSGNFFENFKVLNSIVNNTSDESQYSKKNALPCGILIEKYLKLSDGNYQILSSNFISKSRTANFNIPNSIEDKAVKYGNTYRYVIYNVLLYTLPASNDRFILNRYLLCDYPLFTSDIECKEFERPKPPVNIRFKVNKNKELIIKWSEPSDYQYDAKGYQILKRQRLEDPFQIIAQLEGHNENDLYEPEEFVSQNVIEKTPGEVKYSYIDLEYDPGKITIYTIRTIDAHGLFSDYSAQIAILYDPFENKVIVDQISESGAKVNKPNELLSDKSLFFKNKSNITQSLNLVEKFSQITLFVTPEYNTISDGADAINGTKVFKDDDSSRYLFTMLKTNTLDKHEKLFKITNFN